MEKVPQLTDHPHGALLGEAQHLLVWLIDTLLGLLREGGAQPGPKLLRHCLREYLAPAEAVLRRALRLLADGLAPLPLRTRSTPAKPPHIANERAANPRRPVFRLNEPAPRKAAAPLSRRPQISVAGEAPPPPARTPDPAAFRARFLRRLGALEAAFADPMRYARRLLRQRSPARKLTLAYVRIPGAAAKCLAEEGRNLLRRLNDAAMSAELLPNTS